MTTTNDDPYRLTAAVKRAISATLDRMRAERAVHEAYDEFSIRATIEKMAMAEVPVEEKYLYHSALSVAHQREAAEGRL